MYSHSTEPIEPLDRSTFTPGASIAMTTALCTAGTLGALSPAYAQDAPAEPVDNGEELPEYVAESLAEDLYEPVNVSTPKFTQPLVNIPQTYTVIPEEVIDQQGATSLREVLRNVPGISIQAGEGGVPAGDNLSIRGFNARTDLFIDGVRDFGSYSRDPFNLEQVEVAKGPSSSNAGRGSTGGSVNLVSKTPRLGSFYESNFSVGTDDLWRGTLDINQQLNDTTAFRLNALYHESNVPSRDPAGDQRWGIAASIAFGLDTDTRFTASYFHLDQDNLPDYGIPWVSSSVTDPRLVDFVDQAPPVPFSNYYGQLGKDFEYITTDIGTLLFEHDFSDNLTFRDQFRVGATDRFSNVTAPRFTGNGSEIRREHKTRDQQDTIWANQTDFLLNFDTGSVGHDVVFGFEFVGEQSTNYSLDVPGQPTTDLFNPDPYAPFSHSFARTGAYNDAQALSASVYLFDTIALTPKFDLTGGLRWDYFDVDYRSVSTTGSVTELSKADDMLSGRIAGVYKPVESGSIYLGYGTSFNPTFEGLSFSTRGASTLETDPEESQTIELGTKWELFENRLLLSAALFRTDKTNARTDDPADPTDISVLEGEQRVDGFEIGLAGNITDHWRIFGGYTYLDSEIRSSLNQSQVGNELSNTPHNTFNLWTVHDLPAGFRVGAGAQFVDDRFSNTNNSRVAPSYWLFDAMVGYEVNENFDLQLNFYNILDEEYIDRVGGGHFVPGPGSSVMFTGSVRF